MKRQVICSIVLIALCTSASAVGSVPGNGTPEDPYLIYTKEHLFDPVLKKPYPVHIRLMEDIDFKGQLCPKLMDAFYGVLDGNHKSIKNVYMEDQHGLFYWVYGTVKDLALVNPVLVIKQSLYSVAFFANNLNGTLSNCHVVNGILNGQNYHYSGTTAGGLVRRNLGEIRNCSFTGRITAEQAGGLVDYNEGLVENCYANVDIHTCDGAGGLVLSNRGTIHRCSTEGIVSCEGTNTNLFVATGGLVGTNGYAYSGAGIITDCHSHCTVSTYARAAGGLVGNSWSGRISNCFATGSVTGYSYLGGFVGTIQTTSYSPERGLIENCFSTGNVSGDNRIGGFAGENGSAYIRNCYSSGSATGINIVGGFTGCIYFYPYGGYGKAIIDSCYSTGKVTGSTRTGGLIGRNLKGEIVTNCFWDKQTSGWSSSPGGGVGLTTAQMQTQSNFTNWDFSNRWYMAGYPILQWELSPIQPRIDAAFDGDVITVEPGVSCGKLFFKGKNIILTSTDPADPNVIASTVLDGGGLGSVVTFAGSENETCVLEGFTIRGGYTKVKGGGINGNLCGANVRRCFIENNTSVNVAGGGIWGIGGVVEHCIIRNNRAAYGGGSAACNGLISNCLIVQNTAKQFGNALNNCDGIVQNCTIATDPNGACDSLLAYCDGLLTNCIFIAAQPIFDVSTAHVTYSCGSGITGEGNIETDPMLVDPNQGDYHLLRSSPCVNTGDLNYAAVPGEIDLDGNRRLAGRIDMGAYEFPNSIPIANAGEDQIIFAGMDSTAAVTLDGSGSFDADGNALEYFWYNDANDLIATGAEPNVILPAGEHVITLIVNDGFEDSEPNDVVITVVEPIITTVQFMPSLLSTRSGGQNVLAKLILPEGVLPEDIDVDTGLTLDPWNIKSTLCRCVDGDEEDFAMAAFSKQELLGKVTPGECELTIYGKLSTGQIIGGWCKIIIK